MLSTAKPRQRALGVLPLKPCPPLTNPYRGYLCAEARVRKGLMDPQRGVRLQPQTARANLSLFHLIT